MDWGGPSFVIAIIAVSYGGWIVNNWIRARHGYELEDEWGGKTAKAKDVETAKLEAENRELHKKLDTMQDRMIVLEKIVTDRGYSLADEIEALRGPGQTRIAEAGVPFNLSAKEAAQ